MKDSKITAPTQPQGNQIDAELRLKELLLLESQKIAQIGSWIFDVASGEIFWTEETYRLYGVAPEHGAPSPEAFYALIHEDDRAAMQQWIRQCVQGELPGELEFRVPLANGGVRLLCGRGRVKLDALNKPAQIIGTVQDITKRKQLEIERTRLNSNLETLVAEQNIELKQNQEALANIVEDLLLQTVAMAVANERLQEIDQLKSLFIASMSHELRTPLNSIIGFSSILLNEWEGPLNQKQKTNLGFVLKAGKHLLALINDIIDTTKVEAGSMEVVIEAFDLHDLCIDAVGLLSEEAKAKGLALILEPRHHPMRTDRRRLLQCLMNLIGNAIKYTERGVVGISAVVEKQRARRPARVVLSVADTGIGIAPGDRSKLFVPFVRLESPMKYKVTGSGLGLYLTRRIAQMALSGEVGFRENEGGGSVFTLTVPDRVAGGGNAEGA